MEMICLLLLVSKNLDVNLIVHPGHSSVTAGRNRVKTIVIGSMLVFKADFELSYIV